MGINETSLAKVSLWLDGILFAPVRLSVSEFCELVTRSQMLLPLLQPLPRSLQSVLAHASAGTGHRGAEMMALLVQGLSREGAGRPGAPARQRTTP